MSQTVAEVLVDQMVVVGIRNVYAIVGDSAKVVACQWTPTYDA